MSAKLVLGAADYALFSATLLASAGVGVYFQGGAASNEDYLLGGRDMSPFPVALSVLATFMSATNLMGVPAEVYMYGTNLVFINLAFVVAPAISNYCFLPVFFAQHYTSVYEYLEKRFGKLIRRILSGMFSLQIGLFTAATLYGPALALSAVTDLSLWMSILAIGVVCTFYCTLGGMKAVLWTDVLQALLMYTTLFVIIIVGSVDMGLGNIFRMSYDGERLLVPSFSGDLSKQYTMENILVQGMLLILSTYGGSQIALQRLMSVKSLQKARLVTNLSIPLCVSFQLLCTGSGLVVYAYFKSCDPLTGPDALIHSPDQLMPLFITNAMSHLPGLPGLCIAGIFSASLSTVSSAVNSLAAVTYEDFVAPIFPTTRSRPVMCTKLLSVAYGCVCIALSFVMANLGNLVKLTILIIGMFAGPNLAVFILGVGTTAANEEGVAIGLIVSLAVGAYLNFVPESRADPLLPISDECPARNISLRNTTVAWRLNSTGMPTEGDGSDGEPFPVAYMWFATIGMLTCLIIGYFCSMVINFFRGTSPDVPEMYLSPVRTWFFEKKGGSTDRGAERQATDGGLKNQRDTTL